MKQMQIPETQTELSMACDDFLEIRDSYLKAKREAEDMKDAMKEAGAKVALAMIGAKMDTMTHGGRVFFVKEPDQTPNVIVKGA